MVSGTNTHWIMTGRGLFPKTPVIMVATTRGVTEKTPPRRYFVGGCLVTVRP
jgi:hypothetical protein